MGLTGRPITCLRLEGRTHTGPATKAEALTAAAMEEALGAVTAHMAPPIAPMAPAMAPTRGCRVAMALREAPLGKGGGRREASALQLLHSS
jgi:hypothetical protein